MKNFPKGSTFETTGLLVLGLVAGAMAGRGIIGLAPNKTGLTADQQKTQDLVKYGIRAAVAGAGYVGGTYAKEQKSNTFIEGLGYGAALIQVLDVTTELSGKSAGVQKQVAAGTQTGKILGSALGLKCPCDNVRIINPALNGFRKKSYMRGPGYNGTPVISEDAKIQALLAA